MTSGRYDLLVRGGRVVDPANAVDAAADVAVTGGRVADVGADLAVDGRTVVDARGAYVFPGLVDLHVHLAVGDGAAGPRMLARAGVTTALDLGGPVDQVMTVIQDTRAGTDVATLEIFYPGRQLPARPKARHVRAAIERVLDTGGLGVKLHVDAQWDPDTAAVLIAEGNALSAWVAVHCGTTTAGSDVTGMAQTVELAGDHAVHVAHVNSYCRGETAAPWQEAERATELLRSAPQHFAESYLASINGNFADCDEHGPRPRVRRWLCEAGYDGTTAGLRQAIRDGWASVTTTRDEIVELVSGDEGVAVWEAAETRTGLCLPVNPASSRLALATSKDAHGRFDVHALATDGGGFPRNVTIRSGLALVDLGALTVRELVTKCSWAPARALGLWHKGHLGVGAQADLTIVDPSTREVRTTVVAGTVVYHEGLALRSPARVITTPRGRLACEERGFDALTTVAVESSGLYKRAARAGAQCIG